MMLSRLGRIGLRHRGAQVAVAPLVRHKSTAALALPGRLGDPSVGLATDPRTHPGVIKAFEPFGLAAPQDAPPPVKPDAPYEELVKWSNELEGGFGALFKAMVASWPKIEGVEMSTEVIKGVDGNDIKLFIHKPKGATSGLPCMLHTHGGGMTVLSAEDENVRYWRDAVANKGMICVGVEFRNAGGRLGPHPFPAGLNDCFSGLQWCINNKTSLGYSKLIISGESGGGNLCIATCLKAKQDGIVQHVDGVYAMCPYIYGKYGDRSPLASLTENDGYFLGVDMMASMAPLYDYAGKNAENPLAWPYFAKISDLEGLPPHVISVNELDPLRDEGLAFYRKLVQAGVPAVGRMVIGTPHAGDMMTFDIAPEVSDSTLRDIKSWTDSL